MKLRCDLHVNGGARKLVLVPGINESTEHLALKLAAYLLFWAEDPIVDAGTKNPALANYEFLPDLMALDEDGSIKLWVECGSTTMHKLKKLTRRLPRGRIVVLKETERDGQKLREDLLTQLDRQQRVEIFAWPGSLFRDWVCCLLEKTEVYGESGGLLLNIVVNEHPFVAELKRF
ncbi:MAG TPA: hypothetical protein DEB40_03070 [Elusimicrobia bacterium]|nr:hypothetical protein [Elusimicrobiota bacterium]HBT60712.1 hypothetical protein [Elusimicrobiota bacterium]